MTKRPPNPWKQAFDKLGERPGKDDLRQAFEIDLTPPEPPCATVN